MAEPIARSAKILLILLILSNYSLVAAMLRQVIRG